MKSIFISAYNIDKPPASILIAALRKKGVVVEHSPSNPDDGTDPKWKNWYDGDLAKTLSRCEGFVAVIDETWDSSSWMAEECREAMSTKNICYWNPNKVIVRAQGMVPYLKSELPTELNQALEALEI